MENDPINRFPPYPADHALKSLSDVEKQLRARLLIERQGIPVVDAAQRRAPISQLNTTDIRMNVPMPVSEFFSHGKLKLPGQLNGFSATMDRDTFRMYLNCQGGISTVIYINTYSQTCLATSFLGSGQGACRISQDKVSI